MYFSLENGFHDIHNRVRWVVEFLTRGYKISLVLLKQKNRVKDIAVFFAVDIAWSFRISKKLFLTYKIDFGESYLGSKSVVLKHKTKQYP